MIKSDFGTVEIRGSKPVIMAEFSCVVRALKNHLSKDVIMECVNDCFKTDEEILKDSQEVKEKLVKELFEKLFE